MPWLHVKQNYFEIISVFYFKCNHWWWWLHVKRNTRNIISKLFQWHISHVTTSEIISKLYRLLKLLFKIISATSNTLEKIFTSCN